MKVTLSETSVTQHMDIGPHRCSRKVHVRQLTSEGACESRRERHECFKFGLDDNHDDFDSHGSLRCYWPDHSYSSGAPPFEPSPVQPRVGDTVRRHRVDPR